MTSSIDNRPVRTILEWSISVESFVVTDVIDANHYSIDLAYVDIDGKFTSHEFVISIFTRIDKFDGAYSTFELDSYWFIINHA